MKITVKADKIEEIEKLMKLIKEEADDDALAIYNRTENIANIVSIDVSINYEIKKQEE